MRPEVLMRITGHKKIQTMLKYNKMEEEMVIKEMRDAWG